MKAFQTDAFHLSAFQTVMRTWLLRFDGVTNRIAVPALSLSNDFEFEFKFIHKNTKTNQLLISGFYSGNAGSWYVMVNNNALTWRLSTSYAAAPLGLSVGTTYTIKFKRVGDDFTLIVNGVSVATRTQVFTMLPFDSIGADAASVYFLKADLYYVKYTDYSNSANNRNYDATASGGLGNILPETLNNQNGTQVGTWPSDNAEWIEEVVIEDIVSGSGRASVNVVSFGTGVIDEGDQFPGSGYAQVEVGSFGVGIAQDTDIVSRSGYAIVEAVAFGTAVFQELDISTNNSGFVSVVALVNGSGSWEEVGDITDSETGSGFAQVEAQLFGVGSSLEIDSILGNGNLVVLATTFGTGTFEETFPSGPDIEYGSGYLVVHALAQGTATIVDNGAGWDVPSVLFVEMAPIVAISLTFDQLGRPIIFYQTAGNDLKLYWFDPVAGQNVTQLIATGQYPAAAFDYLGEINYQESDAWIFYVKGNSVYSRIQRERWATEHLVRTYPTPPIIRSAGYTVKGRLQIVVDTEGACPVNDQVTSLEDTLTVFMGFGDAALIGTYVPVEPPEVVDTSNPEEVPAVPVHPPVVEDPEPPVVVDPPEVVAPTTPQGYLIQYPWGVAWTTSGLAFAPADGGFKISVKIKQPVNTVNPAWKSIFNQTKRINTSPTNDYVSTSFSVWMMDGKFHVSYLTKSQITKRFWEGGICPRCRIQLEIKKNGQGVFRFWKETADGAGYEDVDEYQFPEPFVFIDGYSFPPNQNFSIGGTSWWTHKIAANAETVFRDFVCEYESGSSWVDRVEDSLGVWNTPLQAIFWMPEHKSQYWIEVTGA